MMSILDESIAEGIAILERDSRLIRRVCVGGGEDYTVGEVVVMQPSKFRFTVEMISREDCGATIELRGEPGARERQMMAIQEVLSHLVDLATAISVGMEDLYALKRAAAGEQQRLRGERATIAFWFPWIESVEYCTAPRTYQAGSSTVMDGYAEVELVDDRGVVSKHFAGTESVWFNNLGPPPDPAEVERAPTTGKEKS
jgi:hypothetical protein